jgi:DNA-binding protein HU-beta
MAVGAALAAIEKALKKGDSVTLVGFGTFDVHKRNARNGRNPQTGTSIVISPRKVLTFKPSPVLKSLLND